MAVNETPSRIVVPSRNEISARWLRDYSLRNPSASTAEGEEPHTLSLVFADQIAPLYAEARRAGDALTLLNQYGDDLDNTWAPRGIPRNLAKGGSGFVRITAASGGGPIFLGDECKIRSGLVFRCTETRLDWQDGDLVPVIGVDTGPGTNLTDGTKLTWQLQRPGIGLECIVVETFAGGVAQETDDDYKDRIADRQANPEAAGNSAEVAGTAEDTPGVPVEKAFVYPCILGATTTAVVCTVRPATANGQRAPSEPQRAAIEAYVAGQFPEGENYLFPVTLPQPVSVAAEIRWARAATGWQDLVPWPAGYSAGAGRIVCSSATSSVSFVLTTDNAVYSGVTPPQAGNTIAFFDLGNSRFSRKRIASVSGAGPWAIVCSTELNASDTAYVPEVGQWVGPWSESLPAMVPRVMAAFSALGPGEMVSSPYIQDGQRRVRSPRSDEEWRSAMTAKALNDVLDATEISTGTWTDGLDTPATVGTPGTIVYQIVPKWVTFYAKS